jgi:hypothetical protein
MLLKILNFLFVLLGLFEAWESAEIPPLPSRLVFLARIKPVFPGLELANHKEMDAEGGRCVAQGDAC